MLDPGLSCADEERSEDEEDQRRIFCLPCSSRASDLLCASLLVCMFTSMCVCVCVCTRAHTYGRRAGLEERIHFTLEEALWLAQTICCFILYSVACLSAKTTNNVGRTRYKRRKVQKHWASSESTQLTTAISQVSSHWFISRCKLVGLDRFSVVGDACSPCVASLKWGQLLLSPV